MRLPTVDTAKTIVNLSRKRKQTQLIKKREKRNAGEKWARRAAARMKTD